MTLGSYVHFYLLDSRHILRSPNGLHLLDHHTSAERIRRETQATPKTIMIDNVSPEMAIKLRDAGWSQKYPNFRYVKTERQGVQIYSHGFNLPRGSKVLAAAPTAVEILEQMPHAIRSKMDNRIECIFSCEKEYDGTWSVCYRSTQDNKCAVAPTLADAAAYSWIGLKKDNLI